MAIMELLFDMDVINSQFPGIIIIIAVQGLGSIGSKNPKCFCMDVVKLWNVIYERIQQFTLGLCSNFETNKNIGNTYVVTSKQKRCFSVFSFFFL